MILSFIFLTLSCVPNNRYSPQLFLPYVLTTFGTPEGVAVFIWEGKMKEIPGFDGYYADEFGIIWTTRSKGGIRLSEPIQMRTHLDTSGYSILGLCVNGKQVCRAVHRLVLLAFVGECPEGMQACHNNGIKTDNRVENLRWDTRENNYADRILHGTDNSGERAGTHKLTDNDILVIRQRCEQGESRRKVARDYGVAHNTINAVVNKTAWRHI